jgi:ribosomal protein S19
MTRSKWKGPFLGGQVFKVSPLKKTEIWCRSSVVPSYLVGTTVFVHSGKEFKRVLITREKVGYKFGDFSLTRKTVSKIKANAKKSLKK